MSDFDDVVISSRIRLARNIKNLNFPNRLSDYDEALSITKAIYEILNNIGDFEFFKIKNMTNIKSLVLLEKHLISKELLDNKDISSLAISYKDGLSVMINEEDHIMLFLPALTMLGKIDSLASSVSKLGLTVRGAYGEGSLAKGYMYQISNENTMGKSEEELIKNVQNVTIKICEMEKEFRQELFAMQKDEILDIWCRAWGILNNAHKISCDEAIKLISEVKLGMCLYIKDLKIKNIDLLMEKIQPAHLIEEYGKEISSNERDIFRMKVIKNWLEQK